MLFHFILTLTKHWDRIFIIIQFPLSFHFLSIPFPQIKHNITSFLLSNYTSFFIDLLTKLLTSLNKPNLYQNLARLLNSLEFRLKFHSFIN